MSDPKLRAQLRIQEIDGMLEELNVQLATRDNLLATIARGMNLRQHAALRQERQRLCDELEGWS